MCVRRFGLLIRGSICLILLGHRCNRRTTRHKSIQNIACHCNHFVAQFAVNAGMRLLLIKYKAGRAYIEFAALREGHVLATSPLDEVGNLFFSSSRWQCLDRSGEQRAPEVFTASPLEWVWVAGDSHARKLLTFFLQAEPETTTQLTII